MTRFNVKKVAVLGAGVMGAQIAAHLVNVKVPVVLFDLPAKEGSKSAIAEKAIANLKNNLEILRCPRGQILQTDALRYLQGPAKQQFDVVFLDPPFHQDLLANTCNLLEQNQWLREQAWVYTESEAAPSTLQLPGNWRLHREKKTGQVHYALWQRG